MGEEKLFVKIKFWAVINDDGGIDSVRYTYKLPEIDSDLVLELYRTLIVTLCSALANVKGAEKFLDLNLENLEIVKGEEYDSTYEEPENIYAD